MSDSNGMTDGVGVELNPDAEDVDTGREIEQLARPAASAARGAWVDYVVSLGADRGHVDAGTVHYDPDLDPDSEDPDADHYRRRAGGLTKDELVELADRLGG